MPRMVGVAEAIDGVIEANQKGPRPHLGASQVGKPCTRALVYGFRHAAIKRSSGRMLRLFNRGHREEISLCAYLRDIGFEVREYAQRLVLHVATESYQAMDWDEPEGMCWPEEYRDVTGDHHHVMVAEAAGIKLKQWSFSDVGGHHAGSTDGKARNPASNLRQFPALPPDEWFGLEFKTYNSKSFGYLLESAGVQVAKPEHYSQMQEYMHYMGLTRCLYLAVNKNDDRLYDEVVAYDHHEALRCIERARQAVAARQLPMRLHSRPTQFDCKFCDYKGPCHFAEPMVKSCRTCKHVVAVTEGDAANWYCGHWNAIIPRDAVPVGCDNWSPITD